MTTDLILTRTWPRRGLAAGRAVFCPGLPDTLAALVEPLCLLPAGAGNGALMAALPGLTGPCPAVALFGTDPFLRFSDLSAALRRAGVVRVGNFPTTQWHDGTFGAALAAAGHGTEAEVAFVAALAGAGFHPIAWATTAETGRAMLRAGARILVLHPGVVEPAARPAAALRAGAALRELRPEAGAVPLLLHRPVGYQSVLNAARAAADGIVRLA